MKDYRVTIDILREQYVYEVEAKDKAVAEAMAVDLARADGMGLYAGIRWGEGGEAVNVVLQIPDATISDDHYAEAEKMGVTITRGIATLFLHGELNAVTYIAQVWVRA